MSEKPTQLVPLDAPNAASGFRKPLFGLNAESLSRLLLDAGEPAFRGNQIAEAMYRQWLSEISAISTLPAQLRAKLAAEGWQIGRPAIARAFQSVDGTERYLIEFAGPIPKGETAEAVWMPEGDDGEDDARPQRPFDDAIDVKDGEVSEHQGDLPPARSAATHPLPTVPA